MAKLLKSLTTILTHNCATFATKVALKDEKHELTYEDIDRITCRMAINLDEQLGSSEYKSEGIPLLFEKNLFSILTIIAVLKTGRRYIPIDIHYPPEFIWHVLEDTKNNCFISDNVEFVLNKLHVKGKYALSSISYSALISPASNLELLTYDQKSPEQDDVACIMYTSGTTGKPKGVLITHEGIISRTYQPNYISISSNDIFLSHSNLAFDASLLEIWGALLNGGKLVCIEHYSDLLDYKRFKKILGDNKISILWQTTSLFNFYVSQRHQYIYDQLRFLLIGGEAVNKKILSRYLASKSRMCIVVNGYGPTENCIFSTSQQFSSIDDLNDCYTQVAIGRPVDQTKILLVDEFNVEVPAGELGELLCSGSGLAKGYLNQEQLTQEKFIELHIDGQISRYYRTGDLGYYGIDGLIYYVGRKDTQLKMHGFRIELEEIINAILTYKIIDEVIVKAITNNDTFIVAYFTAFEQTVTLENLKTHLCKILPNHMIPRYFVQLPFFPRTVNQKVAEDQLPDPIGAPGLLIPNQANESIAQIDNSNNLLDIEKKVIKVWEKVLGHQKFTTSCNFFDVGGDSIKIMALVSELDMEFSKQIDVISLFKSTSITKIVKNILAEV